MVLELRRRYFQILVATSAGAANGWLSLTSVENIAKVENRGCYGLSTQNRLAEKLVLEI